MIDDWCVVCCLTHNRLEVWDGYRLREWISLSFLKQRYRDYAIGYLWIKLYEESSEWCCLPARLMSSSTVR